MGDTLGVFDPHVHPTQSPEIHISDTLKGDKFREVLAHEVMHACLYFAGLDEVLGPQQTEAVCLNVEALFLPAYEKTRNAEK